MAIKWSEFSSGSAIADANNVVGLQSGSNVKWAWSAVKTYILGAANAVLAIAAAKTLTVSNTLTLAGTDATVMTFPTTSATVARTDAANTFTGASTTTSWVATTTDARGVWTAGATWTLPAVTLGGTVSGGGQQLNNIIIGTTTPLAGSFTTVGATGAVSARSATATPAAASAVAGVALGSAAVGIYWGTGSPNTALTAAKGSLYINTEGGGVNDRVFVNTDASTAWTALVTVG